MTGQSAVYLDWFNQTEMHHDDEMAAAYETQFGEELDRTDASAMRAWVKAFAANGPLLTDSDDAISDAVGAPGQKEPFFGMLSSAKFRDNADRGYKLGRYKDIGPWPGWRHVKLGLIATGIDSPNAAKLFIHYILTEDGIAPQVIDGKLPTNPEYDASTALDDWDMRQDWQAFWRVNYVK